MNKLRLGLSLGVIVLIILTACGGSDDTADEPTFPPATEAPTQAPTEPPLPTEPAAEDEPAPAPTEAAPEPTEEPAEAEIPFDLPIMEGAADMVIQEDTGTILFTMNDIEMKQVIDFYKNEMTAQGWEIVTTSEVGLMGTLVFQSDEARVSVKLSANNIAMTVSVQIIVIPK